jgi:di/tricarboxylate transporter
MAIGFLLCCWAMFHVTERETMRGRIDVARFDADRGPLYAATIRWALAWFGCWSALIVATSAAELNDRVLLQLQLRGRPVPVSLADVLALLLCLLFVVGLFFWPRAGRRLLSLHDLWRELPVKGVVLGVGVLLLLLVVARTGVIGLLEAFIPRLLPAQAPAFVATLILVLVTIFATEVLNNTTVSTVLFPLCVAIGQQLSIEPLVLMLGVSLASTCAFMTPVATPVNALAIAGVGGVSLRAFAKNGAVANLVGAFWIALWMTWLVPPLLRLFE